MFKLIRNHRELESVDLLFNKLLSDNYFIDQVDSGVLNTHLSNDESNYYIKTFLKMEVALNKKKIVANFTTNKYVKCYYF